MNQIKDLVEKAKTLLENNKYEEALGFFEQAMLMNQNDPELWNHKGVALRSMGRYNEALECFNKSLELDTRDKNAS